MRILIIEDNVRLCDTLKDILVQNKYEVDTAYDGEYGYDCAQTQIYDAIILDVMLPNMNGFEIVKQLRNQEIITPILMLTAKSDVSDKVTGLDYGADYYLTKPFETDELLACIKAILRRKGEIIKENLEFGDINLDTQSYTLSCDKKQVRLCYKEFEIMRLLMVNSNQVLPKETILLKLWGCESQAEDNNVEVYISFLRKKLNYLSSQICIKTIRKVGYCLEK